MQNDYPNSNPSNNQTPAPIPRLDNYQTTKDALDHLEFNDSSVDDDIDALALLEASLDKHSTLIAPKLAPSLPVSPVLPAFPETLNRQEPLVSQPRSSFVDGVGPVRVVQQPTQPVPAPVMVEPVVQRVVQATPPSPAPIPDEALVAARTASTNTQAVVDGVIGSARVVSQPSALHTSVSSAISEGVMGSARVVSQPSQPAPAPVVQSQAVVDGVVGSARVVSQPSSAKPAASKAVDVGPLEEPAVNALQKVINSYTQLEKNIADNNAALEDANARLQAVKEKKVTLETKLQEITPPGLPAPLQNVSSGREHPMELDALYQEVKESKINTQNRSCDTVIEYAKSIRKHVVGDTSKAEEYLRPLNLACEILKTNIQHVRTLEQVVELMEVKKHLATKRADVHRTISLLMGQVA